jgi:hypothetical protein
MAKAIPYRSASKPISGGNTAPPTMAITITDPPKVCYSRGYQSVSHFNHQFKTIKFMSPLEYKRKYIKYITILLFLFFI